MLKPSDNRWEGVAPETPASLKSLQMFHPTLNLQPAPVPQPPPPMPVQPKSDMPLPLILAGAGSIVGKVLKSDAVKKIGSAIGNLFKSKKRKAAEKAEQASAKQAAQKAVFTSQTVQNLGTGEQTQSKSIPAWVKIGGGVLAGLAILFFIFKRKR